MVVIGSSLASIRPVLIRLVAESRIRTYCLIRCEWKGVRAPHPHPLRIFTSSGQSIWRSHCWERKTHGRGRWSCVLKRTFPIPQWTLSSEYHRRISLVVYHQTISQFSADEQVAIIEIIGCTFDGNDHFHSWISLFQAQINHLNRVCWFIWMNSFTLFGETDRSGSRLGFIQKSVKGMRIHWAMNR